MSSLFLAGNGFDMAHGIPTSYKDFRSFVIGSYPKALNLRDEIVYIEDFEDIDPNEFAAEILLNTMDKATGENWSNFEEALAYISFDSKLPVANHKEDETDEEDRELMEYYLLYMDILTSGFINCAKIWQDFLRLWMKDIQMQIDSEKFEHKNTLSALFSQSDMQFLTFNYTKTLQKLYRIRKVIHIHNRVGQKLIFGHEKDNIAYDQFNDDFSIGPHLSSSFLDDMVMSFRKDTDFSLKKYSDFFKNLDQSIDKVYSYGFSYGKVDSVYIKKIAPNAIWYFTEFESKDSKTLRIKKIKLRKYGFEGSFGLF